MSTLTCLCGRTTHQSPCHRSNGSAADGDLRGALRGRPMSLPMWGDVCSGRGRDPCTGDSKHATVRTTAVHTSRVKGTLTVADLQTIHALMSQAIRTVPAVGKNSQAPANMGGYRFRGVEDILTALKPIIANLGLFVVPTTLERIESERKLAGGKVQYVVDLHIQFTWYGPLGDTLIASTWGEGSDMGDKATQKAYTSAYKSMLSETFMLADAETDSERHEVPETQGTTRSSRQEQPARQDPPAQRPEPPPPPAPPAGWADAQSSADAHIDVLAQARTLKASVAVDDPVLDTLKAFVKEQGWPMTPDNLALYSGMIRDAQPPQKPQEDPSPVQVPETPPQAQTPAPGPRKATTADRAPFDPCTWCRNDLTTEQVGAGIVLILPPDEGETEESYIHEDCYEEYLEDRKKSLADEDPGRPFEGVTA